MKSLIPICLIFLSSCISDPVGIHRFNVINKSKDTLDCKLYIASEDSNIVISPNDTIKIYEGVNNSGSYTKENEKHIIGYFDSIIIINRKTNLFTNVSNFDLWQFQIIDENQFKVASSYYIINSK
jgi:hypothetical protein